MKTSIKTRIFLITYALILFFIVGLIVINNTFLEDFYTKQKQKTLLSAFQIVSELDLTATSLQSDAFDIENHYNIAMQIIEVPLAVEPVEGEELPVPYERLYGNPFFLRDGVIANIILLFDEEAGVLDSSATIVSTTSADNVAYMAELLPSNVTSSDQFRMLALCVEHVEDNGNRTYYILTVSFQSIQDNIAIFNTFTIVVGVIFMFLSGAAMYFTSYRITTPILAMNQVTQDLANLDFSKKVEVKSNDELGDLGKSINKMSHELEANIEKLKEANRQLAADIELKTRVESMRKEFVANASHELKTPISLILGYSEALKLTGLDQATVEEYLDIIIDESNKMNKLVLGMLKVSQLESGFQQRVDSEFSLSDMIAETLRLFQIKFDEAGITVQVDCDSNDTVFCDYDQLQSVLSNYLMNALHHTEGSKRLLVTGRRNDRDIYRVGVFNTGNPIPQAEMDRIWESFYKIDKARTRAYGGQGLGLSIVRLTLTNLNCQYGCENIDGGVNFYFDVPLMK